MEESLGIENSRAEDNIKARLSCDVKSLATLLTIIIVTELVR